MVTVTVHKDQTAPAATPDLSESLDSGVTINDSRGRQIVLKRPSILDEARLMRALGEGAESTVYLNAYVLPAAMVQKIDAIDVGCPTTQTELDATIQQLGREGMAAIIQYLTRDRSKAGDEVREVKNS